MISNSIPLSGKRYPTESGPEISLRGLKRYPTDSGPEIFVEGFGA